MALYVQYGCGFSAPDGWLNFDASPTLRIQKIPVIGKSLASVKFPDAVKMGDIRKGLPLADGSVDAVYCSHVLEHLALEDCRVALKNTFRLLRPGGGFRLVLPDLRLIAVEYVARSDSKAAIDFLDATLMRQHSRPKGLSGLMRAWIGNSEHLWLWDYESLAAELEKVGFAGIRRAEFGDSGDPEFAKVENVVRWTRALGIQCQRP